MKAKNPWLLNFAQVVLILVALGLVLLPTKITPTIFAWPLSWWACAICFLSALVCAFFAVRLSDTAVKQRVAEHMARRPSLTEQEFGLRYFSSDRAEIAAKLRKILTNLMDVDLSGMKPSDRFIQDLRMDDLDSMSTVEFVIQIEKEFGIEIPNSAAEKMTTFQSVVDYVAEALKEKAQ
ncbi:MAG: acyl carrier protein [Verrucomicrobiota bacterium]